MKKLILILALVGLTSVSALAAKTPLVMVAISPDQNVKVIVRSEPCGGKVLAMLGGAVPAEVKQAQIIVRDKETMEACWMATPDGVAFITEHGQELMLPYDEFKPAEDV